MRYLLDTNAVIGLLRRSSPQLVDRIRLSPKSDLGIPAVVMHELYFGAYRSEQTERNLQVFRALQSDFSVVDLDPEDAREAGAIRAELADHGTPIGPYDVLIAGQTRARNLCLVTNNTREFSRVAGLRIEDWIASQ